MKRTILMILAAGLFASTAFCDNVDKIIADAVAHGAHGLTYTQMRFAVEAGGHYEPRDNSWTNETEYRPITDYKPSKPEWLYIQDSGTIRLMDRNGEFHFVQYVEKRVLRNGGHPVKDNGRYTVQVQLINGRWIDL
jgi:hypothetical protein